MPDSEITLAVAPGADNQHRVVVVLRYDEAGSRVELRQQSWGEGVGWFTQSHVQLEPDQVAAVRSALGSQSSGRHSRKPQDAILRPSMRVVHAESA